MNGCCDLVVLVDDIRDVGNPDIICRNGSAAVTLLVTLPLPPKLVMMDHDLYSGWDGEEVLKRVMAEGKDHWPGSVQFVTMNPVGKTNMENVLKDYGYTWDSETTSWLRP